MKLKFQQLTLGWRQFFVNSGRAFGYAIGFAPLAIAAALVVVLFAAILPFVQLRFFGRVIDELIAVTRSGVLAEIWTVVTIYGALLMITPILRALRSFLEKHYYLRLQEGMDLLVLERRSQIDIADQEDKKFQDLVQRAFHRGHWPLTNLVDQQILMWQSAVAVIAGSVVAIWFDWRLYLIVIIASLPKFITEIKYAKDIWGIFAEHSTEQRRYIDLRQHLTYRISVIETQLYQSGRWLLDWAKRIVGKFTQDQLAAERPRLGWTVIAELLAMSGFVAAVVMVVRAVIQGEVTVGVMAFIITSLTQLDQSISGTLVSLAHQYDANQYVNDIFEVIDRRPALSRPKHPAPLNLATAPEILFDNVSFHYPHGDRLILENINLTIKSGEKIGMVGINGAGKTTLIRLLCRIYDPTAGRIMVNGRDLRTVDLEEWRAAVGVLLQDFTSFDFTVDQAIAMGRVGTVPDDERVESAAALSGADQFIRRWPETFRTQLGVEFGGQELSKGERQKLALARAIYREPYVLILDEPTSSIDAESEIKIFEQLEALPDNVTVLLISHRFNTLRRADRLIVIRDGTISESGTHGELVAARGWYAAMFEKQVASYTG